MQIRWEKLAGDIDKFAVKMAFGPDPDDGRSIDPDVSVSWGGFQLWVKGRNLCAHQEEGERFDSVYWYLLPLVEWLAHQSSFLLPEEHPPAGVAEDTARASLQETRFAQPAIELKKGRPDPWGGARHGWWRRHAIRAAREGGLFPDVLLR